MTCCTNPTAPVPYPTMHHFVTEMCTFVWFIAGFVSWVNWHKQNHILQTVAFFTIYRWSSMIMKKQTETKEKLFCSHYRPHLHVIIAVTSQGRHGVSNQLDHFPQKTSNAELWCFFTVSLNRLLNKQSMHRWLNTLWRSCDITLLSSKSRDFAR